MAKEGTLGALFSPLDVAPGGGAGLWALTLCLLGRRCTWGRRPCARWTGFTSTAPTAPASRPSTKPASAPTARPWCCRRPRVRRRGHGQHRRAQGSPERCWQREKGRDVSGGSGKSEFLSLSVPEGVCFFLERVGVGAGRDVPGRNGVRVCVTPRGSSNVFTDVVLKKTKRSAPLSRHRVWLHSVTTASPQSLAAPSREQSHHGAARVSSQTPRTDRQGQTATLAPSAGLIPSLAGTQNRNSTLVGHGGVSLLDSKCICHSRHLIRGGKLAWC